MYQNKFDIKKKKERMKESSSKSIPTVVNAFEAEERLNRRRLVELLPRLGVQRRPDLLQSQAQRLASEAERTIW